MPDQDDVFELLDLDIHEISIVDNPANDTEWVMRKGLVPTGTGEFATPSAEPRTVITLTPAEKTKLRASIGKSITALKVVYELVSAASEAPDAPPPRVVFKALRLISSHVAEVVSAELTELDQLVERLEAVDKGADASPETSLVRGALEKALRLIAKRDKLIKAQREQLDQLERRVRPPNAAPPERIPSSGAQPQEEFPREYRGGKPV